MKTFLRIILPNITAALCLCMMTVVIVGLRNPKVGLLSGWTFLVFSILTGFSAVTCCAVLFLDNKPSDESNQEDGDKTNEA